MIFNTRKEAEDYRYGAWVGLPSGRPYNPSRCAQSVSGGGRSFSSHQCSKPNGHGPEGLYCRQHDPERVKAKQEDSQRMYDKKMRAQRPRCYAESMFELLKESRESIEGDWRARRDELIEKIES